MRGIGLGGWIVAAAAMATAVPAWSQACRSDVNGDGVVNSIDLSYLLADWGVCIPQPTIEWFTPGYGGLLGGTLITITGTNLGQTSSVTIDGVPCTGLEVFSPTTVRAVTPPGAAGPAVVAVTTPAGTVESNTPFVYQQVAVTSISPSIGLFSGGTPIAITGSYLNGVSSVTIGGVPVTNLVVVNSTTVTAVTPAGSVGSVDVVVSAAKGTATLEDGFTYLSVTVPAWATLLEPLPDPTVVTNASLRNAIIATGYAWRVRHAFAQVEMVLIPPGTFNMGCSASFQGPCDSDENPVHAVTLTNAFYLARYELKQSQWQAIMGTNPSSFQGSGYPNAPNRPVDNLSWTMAQWYVAETGLRMPTEAEWEYAYRAGTTLAFHSFTGYPNGTNVEAQVTNIGWSSSNSGSQTQPVGQKQANGFGPYDMSGNVWEWVNDLYSSSYYQSSPSSDPPGPSIGTTRVLRGGSWNSSPSAARSSNRGNSASSGSWDLGFRPAKSP